MKKLLLVVVLGLGLTLMSVQQASAWSKFNFGVGMNINYEGGGNTVLWGLLKGADSPYAHSAMGGAPVESLAAPAPVMGDPSHGQVAPRPLPNMPRADTQPVGYFQEQQSDNEDFYVPSYWQNGR